MKDLSTRQIVDLIHDAHAPAMDRVQAAATLLHDYHNLGRRTFLTAYEELVRVPDEVLQLAGKIVLHFAAAMRTTPAAGKADPAHKDPAPAKPAAPQPAAPARRRGKNRALRDLIARTDPDAPGFEPLCGRGDNPYRFVCQGADGRWIACIGWSDFKLMQNGLPTAIDAHKFALRAARKFLTAKAAKGN